MARGSTHYMRNHPGKAQNGWFWFPWGGKEHRTQNFDYMVGI